MKRIEVTRYLHQPVQILWGDSNEFTILVLLYLFALLAGGYFWFSLGLIFPICSYKRKQNRGYFNQLLYFMGFRKFKGYPDPSEVRFFE